MGFFDWLGTNNVDEKEIVVKKIADFSSFNLVTDYIYNKSGITDLDKRALTASRLQQYCISEDVYTTREMLEKMKSSKDFYQEVMNIATVNETFFMRELKELQWLVEYIKNSNKKLKILSLPCSSGEEIYSILLMLSELGVDIKKVDITGYDINSYAIDDARNGKYEEHSLHKLELNIQEKYFNKVENYFQIRSEIRNHPSFMQNNIFDLGEEKNKYDIVLSRNMFIYFNDEKRSIALDKIVDILKVDGIYIKGHADHIKNHDSLESLSYGIYKKLF